MVNLSLPPSQGIMNTTGQGSAARGKGRSQQVGPYSLGDILGRGGFGSVYRGLNWMTGETVAIKQVQTGSIPQSELGEIMSEIDLLKNLKHPNIVKYKGSENAKEHLYIILEYCENGSLQNICRRFGKFPEGLVGIYISQVLEGLLYLHDQGVIHRDIKGANILTTKDGSVKLADFGVATKTSAISAASVAGSPYWMAPEVIDQSGATTASDIWSVGCVVIELLEGKPPYSFLDPMPALFRIVQDDCPPLPEGASPIVKDFLVHCFQKDANLRISAKKLSKHPWMISARRQLEQMRSGESMKGDGMPTVYDEAVKSVQEWNEALKEPARSTASRPHEPAIARGPAPAPLRKASGAKEHIEGANVSSSHSPTIKSSPNATIKRAPAEKSGRPTSLASLAGRPAGETDETRNLNHSDTAPPVASNGGQQGGPLHSSNTPIRAAPVSSLLDQRHKLGDLQMAEEQTDNWDNDFEEDITATKIVAALEKSPQSSKNEEETGSVDADENLKTIRPAMLGAMAPPNIKIEIQRTEEVQSSIEEEGPERALEVLSLEDHPSKEDKSAEDDTSDLDDYSDLFDDDEEGHLDKRVKKLKQQNSAGRKLFHPNDLRTLAGPKTAPIPPPNGNSLQEAPSAEVVAVTGPSDISNKGTEERGARRGAAKGELKKYSEAMDEGEDYSDVFGKQEQGTLQHPNQNLQLTRRSWLSDEDSEDDPFAEFEDDFAQEADLEANVARDKYARMCALIVELVEELQPGTTVEGLVEVCEQLETILTETPEMKAQVLAAHGALAVIQLLEVVRFRDVISRLLGLLNIIIYQDAVAQENLCLIGAIPVVMTFTSKKFPHEVRIEAAHFVFAMCSTSSLTLQFVLSCRGLKTLVELIDEDYSEQRDLVWLGVGCVNSVLDLQSPASRNDFCRMLAQEGLIEPLTTALLSVINDDSGDEYAASAKAHILQTLLIYSSSDSWLKKQLAARGVLRRILYACQRLEPASLTLILKAIKNLSMSPSILDELQNCNAIETLASILIEHHDGPHGTEMSNQVLNAMYNLCRLNKSRQEEAAQAGIIPQLLRIARTASPLRQFALPILCDFAHAGKSTRKMLNQHAGLDFYLLLLEDPYWQSQALEAILVWLQEDTARVEDLLLRSSSVASLLYVFSTAKSHSFENLLEPFLKIFRLSTGISLALGKQSTFIRRLIDRLGHGKAVVRLNLLRITKLVCDVHPDRVGLIEQYRLLEIIERLSQNDGAVLVRELAREIATQIKHSAKAPQTLEVKDAHRTVRRAASENNVGTSANIFKKQVPVEESLKHIAIPRRNPHRRPQLLGHLARSSDENGTSKGVVTPLARSSSRLSPLPSPLTSPGGSRIPSSPSTTPTRPSPHRLYHRTKAPP